MTPTKSTVFNQLTQIFLPLLTITGFLLTSMKFPGYGLMFNFLAQAFWLYAGWVAWKRAGQVGLFITSIAITFILTYGMLNYFVL